MFLAGISTFSLVACSGSGGGSTDPETPPDISTETEIVYDYEYHNSDERRTHESSVKKTDKFIIENGTSEYRIVYPSDYDIDDLFATEELASFLEESTGVRLETVLDTGLTYSDSAKYIVLGKTNDVYESTDLDLDTSILKQKGFYIKTQGDCIFIVGNKGQGVVNGVYYFLERLVGYDYVYNNVYNLRDMREQDLPFLTMDVLEVPDIKYNTPYYREINADPLNAKRLRVGGETAVEFGEDSGGAAHNAMLVITKDEFLVEHPTWFAPNTTQLCYLAGCPDGVGAEYDALVDTVAQRMKDCLASTDLEIIGFTHMDYSDWCNCTHCESFMNKYNGSPSATQIKFINDVAEQVSPWYKETFPERELTILIFAYHATLTPPSYKDSKGEWKVADEMVLHEDVAVWYAPYTLANFAVPFNSVNNQVAWDCLESWQPITDLFHFWFYSTHFGNYTIPFDNMSNMQATFQYITKEMDTDLYMTQGQWDTFSSDWAPLKCYMQAKLGWDCDTNFNTIVSNYMKAMFGPAADTMKKYYDDYRIIMQLYVEIWDFNGSPEVQGNYNRAEVWHENLIRRWLSYFDQAYKDINTLQYANADKYKIHYDMLVRESLSPRILLAEFNKSSMNDIEYAQFKASVLADASRFFLYANDPLTGLLP